MTAPVTIPPRSGTAFQLAKGEFLTVIDTKGEQVSDLVVFSSAAPVKRFRRDGAWITQASYI